MSVSYPVVDKDYNGGIYHKLPFYAEDHWKNRHRKEWTDDEITQLMIDHFGSDSFAPAQHMVVLSEYNPVEHSNIIEDTHSTAHWWNLGKIINMGPCAFDSRTFPKGAIASIGDYVVFNAHDVKRTKFPKGNMLFIQDTGILGIVKDPKEYMYGKDEYKYY